MPIVKDFIKFVQKLPEFVARIESIENNIINLKATALKEDDLDEIQAKISELERLIAQLQQVLVQRVSQEIVPISTRTKPWRVRREEFERKDLEEYWKSKGGVPIKETSNAEVDKKTFRT